MIDPAILILFVWGCIFVINDHIAAVGNGFVHLCILAV